MMFEYNIRSATGEDAARLLDFIRKLAEYEKLSDSVTASTERLRKYGFSDHPYFEALLAEDADGCALGMALYFFTFSTFLAKPTLYLEDLFVLPEWRNNGIGKSFFRRLLAIAKERGCGRVEWSVLDWNEASIHFYESIGATPVKGWTAYRLEKEMESFSIA